MERVFDVDGERILVKFQRETGQIFCKTVEFLPPKATPEDEGEPELTADDIKVFLVDPREERPSQTELELVYDEQIHRQEATLDAVHRIEREMDVLLETRMKELSSNEMDVWLYDVKRNPQVKKGRLELERAAKAREESVMDLDIDFIAPFLERWKVQGMEGTAMSAKQIQEMRESSLREIKRDQEAKLAIMKEELEKLSAEIDRGIPNFEEENSKKFFCRMLETKLRRQERHVQEYLNKAEKQWDNDSRLRTYSQ